MEKIAVLKRSRNKSGRSALKGKQGADPMFGSLVQNAFDFMRRSMDSLQKDPKVSVIFFWTAVELFLKARLLKEHWSLVVADPAKADRQKFQCGDFQSVTYQEAVKRLKAICGLRLAGSDKPCFENLREHRNRVVHFCHDGYSDPPKQCILEEIAIEQCRSWYYLHQWLSEEWKTEFSAYNKETENIQRQIRKNNEYLKARFEEMKEKLQEHRKNGNTVHVCVACNYKAAVESSEYLLDDAEVIAIKCLVCEASHRILKVPCPGCSKPIIIEDLGEGTCDSCDESVNLSYLVHRYEDRKHPRDEMIDSSDIYCSECGCTELYTVVPLTDWQYICLNCLTIHDRISECQWCAEKVTGTAEDSYFIGCVLCEGRRGWKDDD